MLAVGGGEKQLDQRAAGGDQMKVAGGHVKRTQGIVGGRDQRHLAPSDGNRLLFATLGFLERREPLLREIGGEGRIILGMEQHAHRGAFAHENIGADDGHVGDHPFA